MKRVEGAVMVGVSTEVYDHASTDEMRKALRKEVSDDFEYVLDVEIGEVIQR